MHHTSNEGALPVSSYCIKCMQAYCSYRGVGPRRIGPLHDHFHALVQRHRLGHRLEEHFRRLQVARGAVSRCSTAAAVVAAASFTAASFATAVILLATITAAASGTITAAAESAAILLFWNS